MAYLPTQKWQVPVTPAATLNEVAKSGQASGLQGVAELAPIPILYGRAFLPALLLNIVRKNNDFYYAQCVWGEGEVDSIVPLVDLNVLTEVECAGITATNYVGTATQTVDPWMVEQFALWGGAPYSDALANIAYTVFKVPMRYGLRNFGAVIGSGVLVYDPRTGSSRSSSKNPALALADFASNPRYGVGLAVDWDSVAAVANACDELVGGLKRREIAIAITQAQDADKWIDTLATYAGCWPMIEGNTLVLVADRPVATSRSFSHASGEILALRNVKRRGIAAMPTVVDIRYTAISSRFNNSVKAYAAGVLAGTTPSRESQVSMPGIKSASQAKREAIERLNKLTLADLSCTIDVFDDALALQPGDVVEVTHPIGLVAKPFRVQVITSDAGRHTLDLLEYDPAVYSDAIVTEPTYPDVGFPNPLTPPAAVTDLLAVEEIYQSKDGTAASRFRITWANIDPWDCNYDITIYRMDNEAGAGSVQVANGRATQPLYVHAPLEDQYWYRIEVTLRRLFYELTGPAASITVQALGKLLAPTDVASLSATITPAGMVLNWPAAMDIDMAGYRLREGATLLATATVTTVNLGLVALGSHTYSVKAYDRSGGESGTAATASITVAAMGVVSVLAGSVATGALVLTWGAATSAWPIAFYEVRFGGSDWATSTLGAQVNATTHAGAANYTGSRTWRVKAVDMAGNYGAEATLVLSITTPGALSPSATLIAGKVSLAWAAATASLPIKHYEIRFGASWAAGTLVAKTDTTDYRVPVTWLGARTFWICAIDASLNEGTPASVVTTISVPSAPTVSQSITLDTANLSWSEPAASLPIAEYEIRWGTDFASGTTLGRVLGTVLPVPVNWGGSRVFWVAAYDINGNLGTSASATVTITAPTAPTISANIIDNNVLLYWAGSTGTLPVKTYELRKGASWAAGTLIGQKSGGFTTVMETASGAYTYWVAAIDSAGNVGTPAQYTAQVSQPPDYILNKVWDSTFTGTLINIAVDLDGSRTMGVNTTETWASHFTGNTYTSPQDQVTAGNTVYVQPGLLPSQYTEIFDYGTLLAGTKVTVAIAGDAVAGVPVVACVISTSPDSVTWTPYSGFVAYGTAYRYVRVKLVLSGGLYDLRQLSVTLDSKIKNDAGMAACVSTDAGGTVVAFGTAFVDVTAIQVTPLGITPITAIYDFVDAPNPTSFKILLFNAAGARVSGTCSWSVRGY